MYKGLIHEPSKSESLQPMNKDQGWDDLNLKGLITKHRNQGSESKMGALSLPTVDNEEPGSNELSLITVMG